MTHPLVDGHALPWDEKRGTQGTILFITTEALLFVVLFFSYFYLGHQAPRWPTDVPELGYALIMLAVLVSSSGVLHLAERAATRSRSAAARLAVAATILLGVFFLVLQVLEYRERLATLRPTDDAYGSIFYTITSIHGAHVLVGLGMLGFVLALPRLEHADVPPHRPLHNAALYWHFVDAVWVVIVAVLYLLPRLHR